MKPLGDVQVFCPDGRQYRYVVASTTGVVVALAVGMETIGFRLDERMRSRALASGGLPYRDELLLPALGFTRNDRNERWLEFEYDEGERVTDYFAVTESRKHLPNETRIAFWAESRSEVDRLAEVAKAAGARNLERPCWEGKCHYAVCFQDPAGTHDRWQTSTPK